MSTRLGMFYTVRQDLVRIVKAESHGAGRIVLQWLSPRLRKPL
ncbi:MAG: hypothetical protein ACRDFA_08805 [bacterium]